MNPFGNYFSVFVRFIAHTVFIYYYYFFCDLFFTAQECVTYTTEALAFEYLIPTNILCWFKNIWVSIIFFWNPRQTDQKFSSRRSVSWGYWGLIRGQCLSELVFNLLDGSHGRWKQNVLKLVTRRNLIPWSGILTDSTLLTSDVYFCREFRPKCDKAKFISAN